MAIASPLTTAAIPRRLEPRPGQSALDRQRPAAGSADFTTLCVVDPAEGTATRYKAGDETATIHFQAALKLGGDQLAVVGVGPSRLRLGEQTWSAQREAPPGPVRKYRLTLLRLTAESKALQFRAGKRAGTSPTAKLSLGLSGDCVREKSWADVEGAAPSTRLTSWRRIPGPRPPGRGARR